MPKKASGLCAVYEKTADYKQLREDLLEDLQARGLVSRPYVDKVNEYMSLWCLEKMLAEDIAERGVYVEYQNGANQKGTTDNKSVEKILDRNHGTEEQRTVWGALMSTSGDWATELREKIDRVRHTN